MNPSPNLFLVGPMGAGKSTIGRRLASRFGLPFIDLDEEIERRNGVAIPLIFELEGEPGFRQRESRLLDEVTQQRGVVLATGGGAVLSADNRQLLRERGFVVYLAATVAQQISRLARDTKRPLLQTPDRRQRLEHMAILRNPLYEEVADMIVPGSHAVVSQTSRHIAQRLESSWQRPEAAA